LPRSKVITPDSEQDECPVALEAASVGGLFHFECHLTHVGHRLHPGFSPYENLHLRQYVALSELDERFLENDPMGFDPTFVIPGCVPAGDSRSERRPGIHSPAVVMDSGLAYPALRASHAPRNDDCC
jgi:hypothetical protein